MPKVAESTVRRLSLYLRFLEEFEKRGIATVSSAALAERAGTTPAQVRKDLSFFGSFGKRGLGYAVSQLASQLREILGLRRQYRVVVVGAGKMGRALVKYRGFQQRGFNVVGVYDTDSQKVGVSWNGMRVRHAKQMEQDIIREHVDIGIIVTPATSAQDVADRLVRAGVRAILNFAPVQLAVPEGVTVKYVDMAVELEALSYALRNQS
jgi:redox-sensing transcriptional repressor